MPHLWKPFTAGSTSSHLSRSVACVPQSIPEVFSSAGGWVDDFEWNPWDAKGLGGFVLPVRLCDLLPHHHVEAPTGLVAEHKAGIVVISVSVHIHGTTEVHGIELIKTCKTNDVHVNNARLKGKKRVNTVCCVLPTAMPGSELAVWTSSLPWCLTTQLGSIWVVPLGSIQVNHLELPEVCDANGTVFRTHIQNIRDTVIVKVVFAGIASSITCKHQITIQIMISNRCVQY